MLKKKLLFTVVISPFERDLITDDQAAILVDEADAVVLSQHGSQAFREVPRLVVLRGDYNLACVGIVISPHPFLVTENGETVSLARVAGHPAEPFGGVFVCGPVPDAHSVLIGVHLHILRYCTVAIVRPSATAYVAANSENDSKHGGSYAEQSQAHLPGGIEKRFEVEFHDRFLLSHIECGKHDNLSPGRKIFTYNGTLKQSLLMWYIYSAIIKVTPQTLRYFAAETFSCPLGQVPLVVSAINSTIK